MRAKPTTTDKETNVLYLRGTPKELARKLRAAAALAGTGLPPYVIEVLQRHVEELERAGTLPRKK
jgi:hypothetical protein